MSVIQTTVTVTRDLDSGSELSECKRLGRLANRRDGSGPCATVRVNPVPRHRDPRQLRALRGCQSPLGQINAVGA